MSDDRRCTCHPSERPFICQRKYAFSECLKSYEDWKRRVEGPSYRRLRRAVERGQLVQFQLPAQADWIKYDSEMAEPSLGYALCKWRIVR